MNMMPSRGFSALRSIDPGTRLILIVGFAAIPGWILFFQGGDNVAWLYGVDQILRGSSVYELQAAGENPYARVYPYLPQFAIFNAILIAPFTALLHLAGSSYSLVNWGPDGRFVGGLAHPDWYIAIGVIITGFWSFVSLISLPVIGRALFTSRETRFIVLVLIISSPVMWSILLLSQVETLLALLAVASALAASRHRWLIAGVLLGLATFKFTGLVLVPVLLAWALRRGGVKPVAFVVAGLLFSQLPNIVYFVIFPEDALLLIEARGGLTLDAFTPFTSQVFLFPLRWSGIENWYIATGYPFIVALVVAFAVVVSLRRPVGLIGGFAVAFVSVSLLIPGEQNLAPLAIFIVIALAPLWHLTSGKAVVIAVIASSAYAEIDLLLGKLSRTLVIGIPTAEYVVFSIMQIVLMMATLYIVAMPRTGQHTCLGTKTAPRSSGVRAGSESSDPT